MKGARVRKVLVFGTALAATCIASLAAPPGATADPTPTPGGTPSAAPATPTPAAPDPGTATTSAEAVQVTPPPPNRKTFVYGPHVRQQLDVYWRESPVGAARPAVLLVHGGAWRTGNKSGWSYVAGRLTQLGYVAIAPNYRLSGHAVWPAQRDDVQTALAYVKAHAGAWGIDPNRIVVVGSSAGGHLATMLGTFGEGGRQVRGVVALSPVNSPRLAYDDGGLPAAGGAQRSVRAAVTELLGCELETAEPVCAQRAADADSVAHAGPGDAPMLLMHSTHEFVPVSHSTALAEALTRSGVEATARTYPGRAHGVGILSDESAFLSMVKWIDSVAKS